MYGAGSVPWAAVRAQANEGAAAADASPAPAEALDARNSRRVYMASLAFLPLTSVADFMTCRRQINTPAPQDVRRGSRTRTSIFLPRCARRGLPCAVRRNEHRIVFWTAERSQRVALPGDGHVVESPPVAVTAGGKGD